MSDNIPLEIQMEIIERTPDIKLVIRCRSVSKAWKAVIDSKDFVKAHTLRHQAHNRHHLLIRAGDRSDLQSTAVIWNPCIRKTVVIAVPNLLPEKYYWTVVGFGVCPRNLDPKLVKITCFYYYSMLQDVNASIQVEVYTLSTGGTWRSPLSCNLPHKSIRFGYSQAVVDGFIHWNAFDRINVEDGFRNPKLIMSFDLTSEEFTKINLPDCLALNRHAYLLLSNLRDSLAVLELKWTESCHVWQMIGHGCTRSFNKLYSINGPDASIHTIYGFRKSGAPIVNMEIEDEDNDHQLDALAIYEPG